MNDGLGGVFRGIEGTGEAVIIGSGPGLDIADSVLKAAQKKQEDEVKKLEKIGSESVGSKWAQSNFDYYTPKSIELRSKFPDVMRAIQNEKDPLKKQVLKQQYSSEWQQLEEESKTDDLIYDEYQKNIAGYAKDKDKFDAEIEVNGKTYSVEEAQNILAAPTKYPEFAEEVQKAGGVSKWRAQNWRKFIPNPGYDIGQDIKGQGIKTDTWFEDDLGNIDAEKGTIAKSGLKPERLNAEYSSFYNRSNLKAKRFQEKMSQMVENSAYVVNDKSGKKILTSSDPTMFTAIENMMKAEPNLKTVEEKTKRLPYYYGKEIFKQYFKTEEKFTRIPNYGMQIAIKQTPGGGSSNKPKLSVPEYYNEGAGAAINEIRSSQSPMTSQQEFEAMANKLNLGDKSGSVKVVEIGNGMYELELPVPPVTLTADGKLPSTQFMGSNVLIKSGGAWRPAPANQIYTGTATKSPRMMMKSSNGITSKPSDMTAIPMWQRVYTGEDANGNEVEFKVQFDLTNPDDQTFLNEKVYYSSKGLGQFDANIKNNQGNSVKQSGKKAPPVKAGK
jgi:hypothetical protein